MLRSIALASVITATAVHADTTTYALVVGSNAAGPGQTALKYAEDDARKVGGILAELGGVDRANVDVVLQPSPQELRTRIERLAQRVAADAAAGKQARIFFYYSGHARATAIDLGPDGLPLVELRQRLMAVPAALTVVVLDACQSGAFSRVKGATPAADFSFNSRQQLDATGLAVLASSSGSELSQESESLRSSYFTHHLLVGMRGAGDANSDGTVSIDEAYRYAYHQTLISTATTAVGGQHVSLEVDLKGHGEVPLSFPRAATRAIVLPANIEGQTLIHDKRAKAVVAETYKAKGAATRVAVAPGEYEVIVRSGTDVQRCPVSTTAGESTVDLARCTRERATATTKKGGSGFQVYSRMEAVVAVGPQRRDGFTQTLENFGYDVDPGSSTGFGANVLLCVTEHVCVSLSAISDRSPTWRRATPEMPLRFDWRTDNILAGARGLYHLGSVFDVYAQVGAGLAIGRTQLLDQDDREYNDTHYGAAFAAGAGFQIAAPRWAPRFMKSLSVVAGYDLSYAPAISNNLDETHASGGHRLTLGLGYEM